MGKYPSLIRNDFNLTKEQLDTVLNSFTTQQHQCKEISLILFELVRPHRGPHVAFV
jgi:hypothetical protein